MASLTKARPPGPTAPADSGPSQLWFAQVHDFLQGVAKLSDAQTFTDQQVVQDGKIGNTAILLAPGGYNALVNLNKVSNKKDARSGGGNAALYIQHLIDNSIATINTVNSGIRVQVETSQQSSASTNDVVAVYAGLFNGGVNTGGFGYHVDLYHASSGGGDTTYGVNVEINRRTGSGFVIGFLCRLIAGGGNLQPDVGFMVAPSPSGTLPVDRCFATGDATFGSVHAAHGLDLAFLLSTVDAIRIPADQWITMDGVAGNAKLRYESTGALRWYISGTNLFGVENTGRVFIVNNANTVVTNAFVASGDNLIVNIGGTIRKVQLGVFP